jgi:hypothetical protein
MKVNGKTGKISHPNFMKHILFLFKELVCIENTRIIGSPRIPIIDIGIQVPVDTFFYNFETIV